MKLKFESPPINEVVIGVYFERDISDLRSEWVGVFWNKVRKAFPTIRSQPPVTPPAAPAAPAQGIFLEVLASNDFPMPRYWIESENGEMLMQIQKNAFLFNWRKREAEYPHYDTVKAQFDRYYSVFSEFVQKELSSTLPSIQIAEINYVNLIERSEYWKDIADTNYVIPGFCVPTNPKMEAKSMDFQQILFQRFEPDLALHTTIRSGRAVTAPSLPLLVLEFRAFGLLGGVDKAEADVWFERAHDMIGDTFIGITNPDIQERYWKKV